MAGVQSFWPRCAALVLVVSLSAVEAKAAEVRSAEARAGQNPVVEGGGSWIFQRSYYSHQPASEVQVGPQTPYGTVFTRPQGAYIRGGYRRLRVGGNLRSNDDYHYFYEGWFQQGEQY